MKDYNSKQLFVFLGEDSREFRQTAKGTHQNLEGSEYIDIHKLGEDSRYDPYMTLGVQVELAVQDGSGLVIKANSLDNEYLEHLIEDVHDEGYRVNVIRHEDGSYVMEDFRPSPTTIEMDFLRGEVDDIPHMPRLPAYENGNGSIDDVAETAAYEQNGHSDYDIAAKS